MEATSLDPLSQQVLRALLELARRDCAATPATIGLATGRPTADVVRVLLVLDARRLACAKRARLTLRGLATASLLPHLRSTHGAASPSGVASAAARPSYAHARRTSGHRAQHGARAW